MGSSVRHPKGARSIGIGHPRSGDRCAETRPYPLDPVWVAEQKAPLPARVSHSPERLDSATPWRQNHHNLSLNKDIVYICILYDRLREMAKNTMGTKLPRKLEQKMDPINHYQPTI